MGPFRRRRRLCQRSSGLREGFELRPFEFFLSHGISRTKAPVHVRRRTLAA
jgi:hypothetical protein